MLKKTATVTGGLVCGAANIMRVESVQGKHLSYLGLFLHHILQQVSTPLLRNIIYLLLELRQICKKNGAAAAILRRPRLSGG